MLLKNVIKIFDKSVIKAGDGKDIGVFPLYTCSPNITKFLDDYIVDDEAIVVSTGGNFSIHYLNGKFNYSTDCLVFNSTKFRTKYLFYYLLSNKIIINDMFRGAGIKHLNKQEFMNLNIGELSLEKQDEIIKKLDTISETINDCKNQIIDLDNLIKSQFITMFGNISEYDRLEDYSILITKGASPKWQGVNYQNTGTLFITSENVRVGYVDITKPKFLENKINDILPRSILKKNDILINIVGASIGRAAKYDYDYLANINQAVALVRTKNINNVFLITYLNSDEAKKMYDDMKKGVARENLSLKNIADLRIPKASIELQNDFAKIVKEIDNQKIRYKKDIEDLEKLLEIMLYKYFCMEENNE